MRHLALLTTLALFTSAVALPASAFNRVRPLRPQVMVRCAAVRRSPAAVVEMWIGTRAQALPDPCALAITTYRPSTSAIRDRGRALVEPLGPQSQPGHRLYLVLLLTNTHAARYLLDLRHIKNGLWQVDLWAQL